MALLDDICSEVGGLEVGTYIYPFDKTTDTPDESASGCPASVLKYCGTLPTSSPPPESYSISYRIVLDVYLVSDAKEYKFYIQFNNSADPGWNDLGQFSGLCITSSPCPSPDDCLCGCLCGCDCSE